MHVRRKRAAILLGIAGLHSTFVPHHSRCFAKRFALPCDLRNLNFVAMGRYHRRKDRNALSRFCKRKQIRGSTALKPDIWLHARETTHRIELPADKEPCIKQKQRIRSDCVDLHRGASLEKERMEGCLNTNRRHGISSKAAIIGTNGLQQNTQMNFAAL